jgi:hypothetical protein
MHRLARLVLRSPAWLTRAAASQARTREERWMLHQPKRVRDSFVREVIDHGGDELRAEIWMLRQPDNVRDSYVREVLEPRLNGR